MIGKHLQEYKKAYLADRKKYKKTCTKKNSDWKKRWLPFIKYDHDFDGDFLIELIVHKLHIMLDYYDHGKYCWQIEESRLEIVESLKEACRLGDLILEDNFNKPAFEIMEKHFVSNSEEITEGCFKGKYRHISKWDSEENKLKYEALMKKTDELREKTIDQFFDYIRKHYREWWD